MTDTIAALDDRRAQQILAVIARSRSASKAALDLTPEVQSALASSFGLAMASAEQVSEGELARQALLVLAEERETGAAIEALAAQPVAHRDRFDFGSSIAVVTAAIIVLQTHLRIERDKEGRWIVKLEKKTISDAVLKEFVKKLLEFIK